MNITANEDSGIYINIYTTTATNKTKKQHYGKNNLAVRTCNVIQDAALQDKIHKSKIAMNLVKLHITYFKLLFL